MFESLRYWRPWRLFLIRLSYVFEKTWIGTVICDYLYPDNTQIRFN